MRYISAYLLILSAVLHTKYSEITQYPDDVEYSSVSESHHNATPSIEDLAFNPDKFKEYKYIVKIGFAGKIYMLGIYFRPRYAVVSYTNLFYYDEFDIYIMPWFHDDFRSSKYTRRIINAVTYTHANRHCDFNMVLVEIDEPFSWSKDIWNIKFMTKSKPPPNTRCMVANIVFGGISTVRATVADWTKANCSKELGFLQGCNVDSFLCLTLEKPTEFDIIGSPVTCNDMLVGTIPRYYISEIVVIQYLPLYQDWIFKNSDPSVRCGCCSYLPVFAISAVVTCVHVL